MKSPKILLLALALSVSLASFSQVDTTKKDTTKKDTTRTDTTKKRDPRVSESANPTTQDQQATVTQPSTTNTTTDNSATTNNTTNNSAASSVPKPNFGRYYIPVLGSYNATATTADNKSITVSGDESNPGKIWIEGLNGTKFYALLKAVPGTYKIPAQKQEDNTVAEGTVVYDENSKQINLCLGCGYNDESPAAVATTEEADTAIEPAKGKNDHHKTAKVKKPAVVIVSFVGTKADQGTVSILQ